MSLLPPGLFLMLSGGISYLLAKRRDDEFKGCLTVAGAITVFVGMALCVIGLVQEAF